METTARAAAPAIEARGVVFVSAGAGHRQDDACSSSASCARCCERGLDVDSILVITYTRARRRRAARRGSALRLLRARPPRPGARARRRLDLDHPRLLRPAPARASVRGRARPALPRARRQPGRACSAARRSTRRSRSSAGRRRGAAAAARHVRRPPAAADADRRARDAALGRARRSCSSWPSGRRWRSGWRSCASRRGAGRTSGAAASARASSCSARARPEELLDLSDLRAAERADDDEARRRSSRPRSTSTRRPRPGAAAGAPAAPSPGLPRGEGPRVGARLRGPAAATRGSCCATTPRSASASSWRFRSIMVDEFQDTNRLQCELVDLLAHEDARSSSSATSSSRSTASGTRTSRSSASGASRSAACSP